MEEKGSLPSLSSSQQNTPKDHTSLFSLQRRRSSDSGDIQRMGTYSNRYKNTEQEYVGMYRATVDGEGAAAVG